MSWEKAGARGWALPGYGAETEEELRDDKGPEEEQIEPIWEEKEKEKDLLALKENQQMDQPAEVLDLPPLAVIRLPASFSVPKQDLKKIAGYIKGSLPWPEAREVIFKRIGVSSGTWIKMSENGDRCLHLWGNVQNVERAKAQLQQLIDKISESQLQPFESPSPVRASKSETKSWTKLHPEDFNTTQNSGRIEEQVREKLRLMPKSPTSDSMFLFSWPLEGLSIEESVGRNSEKLDPICKEFGIEMELWAKDGDYIAVRGYKDDDLPKILDQLNAIWKQAMAKLAINVKAYLVDPVPLAEMRKEVILVKSQHHKFTQPYLCGDMISPSEITKCLEQSDSIMSRNNEYILKSFEKALIESSGAAEHLRMRVHFGTFVYDRYQQPEKGKGTHLFHDFQAMVRNKKASGRLLPGLRPREEDLIMRCIQADHIFEQFDPSKDLGHVQSMPPNYSLGFEVSGDDGSPIRLEIYYKGNSTTRAPGNAQWLKIGRAKNGIPQRYFALQVSVTSFMNADWQADIEYFETVDVKYIDQKLATFAELVMPTEAIKSCNIGSKPVKKFVFPDEPFVKSFEEKAAIQLKIKGTDYVFELARFDKYSKERGSWTKTPTVSWGASLFDPAWSKVLGSQLQSRTRFRTPEPYQGLAQLFPTANGANTPADPNDSTGFWEFIEIVRRIAEVLGCEQTWSPMDPDVRDMNNVLDINLGLLF
ncbi:hypothetical protein N7468_001776 [Penicillium chermesinum]|uniref:DUF7905 domain-containing protein n=1 Tax=Penicillium chermesinum TaxID=63820 RepID=A0A9W9PJE2_9EURO|nr:uncharacterized protein N7468_001776 [Penicillium chermesinum]KAJ5246793.1 hypothetical protein N7468_001776 [Penicillium chermesinum]